MRNSYRILAPHRLARGLSCSWPQESGSATLSDNPFQFDGSDVWSHASTLIFGAPAPPDRAETLRKGLCEDSRISQRGGLHCCAETTANFCEAVSFLRAAQGDLQIVVRILSDK